MVTIAVDAMGGDDAPKAEVEGAIRAARRSVSKSFWSASRTLCARNWASMTTATICPSKFMHASEHVTMDDSAAKAVRNKRDSSIRVAVALVRDGVADGVVSAGNTGAVMATAKMVQGMLPGVDRPALASVSHPQRHSGRGGGCGRQRRLFAAHAGAVCRDGRHLFPRDLSHTHRPRVGLLSIGEEEHKGNELTRR